MSTDPYLVQLSPGDDEVTRDLAIQRWLTAIYGVVNSGGGGGGFANPMTSVGDLIIGGAAGVATRLGQGANSTFLGVSGGVLGYYTPAGGGNVSTAGTLTSGQVAYGSGGTSVSSNSGLTTTGAGNLSNNANIIPASTSVTAGVLIQFKPAAIDYDAATGGVIFSSYPGSGGSAIGSNLFIGGGGNFTLTDAANNIGIGPSDFNNLEAGTAPLSALTTGYANIAIGTSTGYQITGGQGNTLVGAAQNGWFMAQGFANALFGSQVGQHLGDPASFAGHTLPASNVMMGYSIAPIMGGNSSYNTLIGGDNMQNGAAGAFELSHNVCLGFGAGSQNISSNKFYVGTWDQTSVTNDNIYSLLQGTFSSGPASLTNQQLTVNGAFNIGVAGTAGSSFNLTNATSGVLTIAPPTGALGTVTVTVPAATDTLVNLTSSQTLTNKSLTSPTLTGVPVAPTAAAATNTTQIATTAFVIANAATNPLTTTGDLIYSSSGSTAARLAIGTQEQKLGVNSSGLPAWVNSRVSQLITQTAHGFSAGQVVYYNGSAYALAANNSTAAIATAVGYIEATTTNTFVLVSEGPATASGLTAGNSYYVGTAGAITSTQPSTTGTFITFVGEALSTTLINVNVQAPGAAGPVTVPDGGTGLAVGTSGGILAFTGTTTLASSAALTANSPVLGGGAGVVPLTVAGITSDGVSKFTLGVSGTSAGGIVFNNATSGAITVSPPTGGLGTVTLTLPVITGTLAEVSTVNSQSTAYGFVLTDANNIVLHPSADTTARVFTIPANGSVAYPVGTTITIVNQPSAGIITLAITTDTLTFYPSNTTGSRTIAAAGQCTILKITSTSWTIVGVGVT